MSTNYVASSAVTISLGSLGSSSNFTAGQESTLIDNSSNKYDDYLLAGTIKAGTTPTTGEIRVYVVGMRDDSVWPDGFDGSDSAETATSVEILNSICKPAAIIGVDTTTGRVYPFGPVSVASLFGGVVPRKFVVFVSHNTVNALDSTNGNHVVSITPVTFS